MKIIKPFIQRVSGHQFLLPFEGKCKVKVSKGDKVRRNDLLFEKSYKKILQSYSVMKELGVEGKNAREFVVRLNGEFVVKGEVLAERITKAGLVVKKIYATGDGIVSFERIDQGYIDLLAEHSDEEVYAQIRGEVVDIDLNRGITIESEAFYVDIAFGHLSEQTYASGEFVVIDKGDSVYTSRDLKEDYSGKIVFAGRFVYSKLVSEILEKDALAVIVWATDYVDYELYNGKLVVLGGFGQIAYDFAISHAISSMNGTLVHISEGKLFWSDVGQYLIKDDFEHITHELKVNDLVRVIDVEGYAGIGKVVDTSNEPGYYTVLLSNGQRKLLANECLEIIS
ncbi:hypothetical protein IT417_02995 [bacterium]|nr:hypothetical protein [bacterium]